MTIVLIGLIMYGVTFIDTTPKHQDIKLEDNVKLEEIID